MIVLAVRGWFVGGGTCLYEKRLATDLTIVAARLEHQTRTLGEHPEELRHGLALVGTGQGENIGGHEHALLQRYACDATDGGDGGIGQDGCLVTEAHHIDNVWDVVDFHGRA